MGMASQLLRRALGSRSSQIISYANPSSSLSSPATATARAFSSSSADLIRATLFPGDGIGPEIAESVKQVLPFLLSIFLVLFRLLL